MGAMPKDLLPSIQSKDYRNEVKGYEGAFFYSDKNFFMRKENIIPVKRCKIWHTCTAALNVAKGAGSFHIHRKIMKELGALAVLGIRERPNLAQNLVTYRH